MRQLKRVLGDKGHMLFGFSKKYMAFFHSSGGREKSRPTNTIDEFIFLLTHAKISF